MERSTSCIDLHPREIRFFENICNDRGSSAKVRLNANYQKNRLIIQRLNWLGSLANPAYLFLDQSSFSVNHYYFEIWLKPKEKSEKKKKECSFSQSNRSSRPNSNEARCGRVLFSFILIYLWCQLSSQGVHFLPNRGQLVPNNQNYMKLSYPRFHFWNHAESVWK